MKKKNKTTMQAFHARLFQPAEVFDPQVRALAQLTQASLGKMHALRSDHGWSDWEGKVDSDNKGQDIDRNNSGKEDKLNVDSGNRDQDIDRGPQCSCTLESCADIARHVVEVGSSPDSEERKTIPLAPG